MSYGNESIHSRVHLYVGGTRTESISLSYLEKSLAAPFISCLRFVTIMPKPRILSNSDPYLLPELHFIHVGHLNKHTLAGFVAPFVRNFSSVMSNKLQSCQSGRSTATSFTSCHMRSRRNSPVDGSFGLKARHAAQPLIDFFALLV